MPAQIYLSRRNLLALLAKLDRNAQGDNSSCTIIKYRNKDDPFKQSMREVAVTAIEDNAYYATRPAGEMHPTDEATLTQMGAVPETGVQPGFIFGAKK